MTQSKITKTVIKSKNESTAMLVAKLIDRGKKIKDKKLRVEEDALYLDYMHERKNSIVKRNKLDKWKKFVLKHTKE